MKKGFTLVELLAVIAILATILGMIVISVSYYSGKRKNKDYNNIKEIIEKNTEQLIKTNTNYSTKVDNKLQTQGAACKITYDVLVNNNLMTDDTKNPVTGKNIDSRSYIKVSIDSSYDYSFEFVYVDDDNPAQEILDNCLN